jgi:hypothetical protein
MNLLSRGWQFCLSRAGLSPRRGPEVILHNPAAAMPHDLDDPFHSEAAQEKVGKLIADAHAGEKKP